MPTTPFHSLIEALVTAVESDAGALRERHLLRQSLQGVVRQARMARLSRMPDCLLAGGALDGSGQEPGQQAGCDERRADIH